MIGRLGTFREIKIRLRMAKKAGCRIQVDRHARTATATLVEDGTIILRALEKGGGVWLALYHPDYWRL